MTDNQIIKEYIIRNNYKIRKGVNVFHLMNESDILTLNEDEEFIDVKNFKYNDLDEIFLTNYQAITFLLYLIELNISPKRIRNMVIGGKRKKLYASWWYIRDLLFPIGKINKKIIEELKKEKIIINPIIEFMIGKINNILLADLLSILESNVESGQSILKMVKNNKNTLTVNQLEFINKKIIEINDEKLINEMNLYVKEENTQKNFIVEVNSEFKLFEFNYKLLMKEYNIYEDKVIEKSTYEQITKSMITFLKKKELKNNIENITLVTKAIKKDIFYLLIEEEKNKQIDKVRVEVMIREYFKFYTNELLIAEKDFLEANRKTYESVGYYLKKNLKRKQKNLIQYILLNLEVENKSNKKSKSHKI